VPKASTVAKQKRKSASFNPVEGTVGGLSARVGTLPVSVPTGGATGREVKEKEVSVAMIEHDETKVPVVVFKTTFGKTVYNSQNVLIHGCSEEGLTARPER
jgi:hypothetical protein